MHRRRIALSYFRFLALREIETWWRVGFSWLDSNYYFMSAKPHH